MVEDHGKRVAEARTLARSKGAQMPSAPAKKHQDAAKKLEQASGAAFDKAFMQQMVSAKDRQLRASAEKAVPVIQKHLEMAKTIAASLR